MIFCLPVCISSLYHLCLRDIISCITWIYFLLSTFYFIAYWISCIKFLVSVCFKIFWRPIYPCIGKAFPEIASSNFPLKCPLKKTQEKGLAVAILFLSHTSKQHPVWIGKGIECKANLPRSKINQRRLKLGMNQRVEKTILRKKKKPF